MASFLLRSCPACAGQADSQKPEIFSNPPAESMDFEELMPYWDSPSFGKSFFSYSRCSRCDLLYCRNYFSESQLADLYRRMPSGAQDMPEPALRKTQGAYFEMLKRHSSLEGDYLEIGPGLGLLMERCLNQGNFSHFWLFEPSELVRKNLQAVLGARSHDLFPQLWNAGLVQSNRISAAVMIHVLDHLTDPKKTLLEIKKFFAPGGVLFLVTHNEQSLLSRILGKFWRPYDLAHPQLYSPESMAKLLEAAGYKVLECAPTKNFVSPAGFFKSEPLKRLLGFSFPLKLGNMATVATPR